MRVSVFAKKLQTTHPAFFMVCCVCVGAALTSTVFLYIPHYTKNTTQHCAKKFPHTSDDLDCNLDDVSARLHTLESNVDATLSTYIQQGKADQLSVWVRDLKSKQWAASNENETYSPASLMKLPLLITYYKIAEISPSLLDTPLTFQQSSLLNSESQNFTPSAKLVVGQSYTVSDLLERMIVYSDNDATALLMGHIDQKIFDNTLVDLGIRIPTNNDTLDLVTVKSYANIFRILYNASYLDRDYSEKTLTLLTRAEFVGLQAKLPKDTPVAHKFGEREVDFDNGSVESRELHDCGIVYKGDNPYSVCIMTRGKDFNTLLDIIQTTSAQIYESL